MYFGKVQLDKVESSKLEGTFYWPAFARCTENDQHSAMDLFIIWRYVYQEEHTNGPETEEVKENIKLNLEKVIEKWTKMESNCCLQDKVQHYTLQMLRIIIEQIWESGLDIQLIRKYYLVITKAARDIEETIGLGFRKMIYTRAVVIPITVELEGILRKRPTAFYAISVHVLTRKTATVEMIRDFIDIKDQVQNKESLLCVFIIKIYCWKIKKV